MPMPWPVARGYRGVHEFVCNVVIIVPCQNDFIVNAEKIIDGPKQRGRVKE